MLPGVLSIGQRPVELTKGKWSDVVRSKQNFQPDRSVPFAFRPTFQLLLSEVGLETRIFENGTARFGRTNTISTRTETFHLSFDGNFRKL